MTEILKAFFCEGDFVNTSITGVILPNNKQTQMQVRSINGLEYTFQRKKIKNINLRIKGNGVISVSAPMRCSIKDVESFIVQKQDWIVKSCEKVKESYAAQNAPCTVTKQEALAIFTQVSDMIFPLFSKILAGQKPVLKVRDMKTRWGVCKVQSKVITLNLRLANKPKEAIEYVVLHEYTHFIVHGHGKDFWNALSIYMPDYKARRALLKADKS